LDIRPCHGRMLPRTSRRSWRISRRCRRRSLDRERCESW
jgi:hypothetical protein